MTAQSENETFRREGYGPTSLVVGERGARTRQRIVEETLRLFETQGFHATSVDGIAKAAGTSRSTLYQYFESKEQIFVELLDECGSALMRVVRRIGPLGPTKLGFDNLHWWLGEWAYVYDKYATMFVQWASVDTPGTSVRPLVTGFTHSYNTRIAARLESSGVTGLTPLDAAIAMTSIVHRFNYFRHMGLVPHRFTDDQLLDGLAVFVQLILFPDTPLDVFSTVEQPARPARRPDASLLTNDASAAASRPAGRAATAGRRHRQAAARRQRGAVRRSRVSRHRRGRRGRRGRLRAGHVLQVLRREARPAARADPRVRRRDAGADRRVHADRARQPGRPGQLRDWLGRYLPFHSRYLGIMRAWLEGTSRDPQMLAVVRETGHNMHLAALAVLARVDRPHPLDPDIAAVIQGGILERMPQAAREQDPERPDSEIVELIAAVMERGLYNPGPAR